MRPLVTLASFTLASFALASFTPRLANACATAPPPNTEVRVAEESAIIAWDAPSRTEHFIRRASFVTPAHDFGFLVPTPTTPTLAEAPDGLFTQLYEATRPVVVHELAPELTTLCLALARRSKSATSLASAVADDVRVLATAHVAGYDATVLEAESPTSLARWLDDHGYASRPALAAWLAPYVEARWKVTAFKIARSEEGAAVSSSAVHMSFQAERPFFPYREPDDQRAYTNASLVRAPPRSLRVFFFGPWRAAGAIGAAGGPWPGETTWANAIDPVAVAGMPFALAPGAWLTSFADNATPRPGTDDLFFAPSPSRDAVIPKIVVRDPLAVPVELLAAAAAGGVFAVRAAKRRRRGAVK